MLEGSPVSIVQFLQHCMPTQRDETPEATTDILREDWEMGVFTGGVQVVI
jgi:hypothetical protein